MPRAVVILADLFPAEGEVPVPDSVPRLPVLEYWLSRAQRDRLGSDDWRQWLRQRLGANLPRGSGAPGYWLVTPVHVMPGLDNVRLHGDGLLHLPLAEQRRLVEDFAQVFAGSGWQLMATDARELLLLGPDVDGDAPDPARFLGRSLRDAQLRGAQVAPLRRLHGEVEMWLHGADYRCSGGAATLKVNGLWFWGREFAGPLTRRSDSYARRRPGVVGGQLYADDLAARACAAAVGLTQSGLPDAWPADLRGDLDRYVVLNLKGTGISAQLADIEQRWLRPALSQRQAGQFRAVELVCGAHRWVLDSIAGWRFWRRRTPWLQELLAW